MPRVSYPCSMPGGLGPVRLLRGRSWPIVIISSPGAGSARALPAQVARLGEESCPHLATQTTCQRVANKNEKTSRKTPPPLSSNLRIGQNLHHVRTTFHIAQVVPLRAQGLLALNHNYIHEVLFWDRMLWDSMAQFFPRTSQPS